MVVLLFSYKSYHYLAAELAFAGKKLDPKS